MLSIAPMLPELTTVPAAPSMSIPSRVPTIAAEAALVTEPPERRSTPALPYPRMVP